MEQEFKNQIVAATKPYTLLSAERILCNIESIEKVVRAGIEGDIVECGVWKGGSVMSMLYALKELNEKRNVWLYDTFEGMTEPKDIDKDYKNESAESLLKASSFFKCYSPIEEVSNNINKVGYIGATNFVKGDILNNKQFPDKIALLRLDTDWYDSTKYELENFYPLVSKGGIVIVDDYGYWKGSRLAVDEFIQGKDITLNVIDDTGVWFKKN